MAFHSALRPWNSPMTNPPIIAAGAKRSKPSPNRNHLPARAALATLPAVLAAPLASTGVPLISMPLITVAALTYGAASFATCPIVARLREGLTHWTAVSVAKTVKHPGRLDKPLGWLPGTVGVGALEVVQIQPAGHAPAAPALITAAQTQIGTPPPPQPVGSPLQSSGNPLRICPKIVVGGNPGMSPGAPPPQEASNPVLI